MDSEIIEQRNQMKSGKKESQKKGKKLKSENKSKGKKAEKIKMTKLIEEN